MIQKENKFIYLFFFLQKAKGVEHLIEVENPNRRVQKMQKASHVDVDQGPQQLSRRERYVIFLSCKHCQI